MTPDATNRAEPILIIGNSDGIGLATTRLLLAEGRSVIGLSRSASPITAESETDYRHIECDVTSASFPDELRRILLENPGLRSVIHCAGVGSGFDTSDLAGELLCFRTNLMSVVELAAVVVPAWRSESLGTKVDRSQPRAHLVVLSSVADAFVVPDAPSYGASKLGLSRYLRALGLRLRGEGVDVTNVRFGFVDTKMAQAPVKPFQMTVDRAAKGAVGGPEDEARCPNPTPHRGLADRAGGVDPTHAVVPGGMCETVVPPENELNVAEACSDARRIIIYLIGTC